MNNTEKKYSLSIILARVMMMQFKATPGHSILNILIGALMALLLTSSVIATQRLFDAITVLSSGLIGYWDATIQIFILAGIIIGREVLNGVLNFHTEILSSKTIGNIKFNLLNKLQQISAINFEDTSFLNNLSKAKEGVSSVPAFSITFSMLVSCYMVYFISIGSYLFNLQPLLLVTLVLAFIPALFAQVMRVKVFTRLEDQSAPLRRECEYYQNAICSREYFKETRILGAFSFFHNLFCQTMLLFNQKKWRAERKIMLLQLLLNSSTFVGMAISTYILFTATMMGVVTVGAFAAVFGSLSLLFGIMQEIVTWHIGDMNQNLVKIVNLVRILDMQEQTANDGDPLFSKGVIAENVSFTYRGQNAPAVKDVSLKIGNNETIALVGENGSGKSTLVRLLTGIYSPVEGKVMIGGLDVDTTNPISIYKGISATFQKYQRYKMTLEENVTISDLNYEIDILQFKSALDDACVEYMDIGIDTMLAPEFDGIDLSGGQWQRLAIARGLYRTSGFIVLDEPTAAIDPIEEQRIYSQFKQMVEGKCTIIVTHRLGSTKLANRIVVMDAGRIADIGTHAELLSRPGKYAEMWEAQAKWYI